MRLIETFSNPKSADEFSKLLSIHHIESSVESQKDAQNGGDLFLVWVQNEDDIDEALKLLERYKIDPGEAQKIQSPQRDQPSEGKKPEQEEKLLNPAEDKRVLKGPVRVRVSPYLMHIRQAAPLTKWVIILCALIFFWSGYQKVSLEKENKALATYVPFTPLALTLIFDYDLYMQKLVEFFKENPDVQIQEGQAPPKELRSIQMIPQFRGYYDIIVEKLIGKEHGEKVTLFGSISKGQVWRVFTPALLHAGILHILFNMLWLWLLGKQVELKIGRLKYLLVMLIVGSVANTAQYLMSGPYFLGYSGVICGLGGFIWVRQKAAPWEGYNVHKTTLLFLGGFVLALVLVQLASFIYAVVLGKDFSVTVANTAHVVGILSGMILAKIPYFYKIRS